MTNHRRIEPGREAMLTAVVIAAAFAINRKRVGAIPTSPRAGFSSVIVRG